MANQPAGGPEAARRRRVTTVIGGDVGISTLAQTVSNKNGDLAFCDRHFISIIPIGTVTGGTIRVRARPIGAAGVKTSVGVAKPVPIGVEAVNLATATTWTFEVGGYFDGFEVNATAAVTGGGKIAVVVNSTQTN
jgi:hypothetical protein